MGEHQKQITADPIYNTVAPDDFPAMIDPDRYQDRTTAFDKIISATHDHFWDPLDTRYIDFSVPFDQTKDFLIAPEIVPDRQTAIWDKLDEPGRIKLANLNTWWALSSILHGEQGALSLSASLVHILRDPGAQEYAANQAREEARHVTGFSRYVAARWGKPTVVGPALRDLLTEIVNTDIAWKKIVGMQILVEGLAMGAFAMFYNQGRDPLLVHLCQLVMTDEAFHHKFGKIWADRTIPKLLAEQREEIEDWSWNVFQTLLFNLTAPDQKAWIYKEVGIDPDWAQQAFLEAMTDELRRQQMKDASNIFRVLIKTMLKGGIITKRTSGNYAAFVDMEELHDEGEHMVGDSIAEKGIAYLRKLNGANDPESPSGL